MQTTPNWAVPGAGNELAPGIFLRHMYYYSTDKIHIEIPCTGWQHAVVWFTENKAHIFCPFSEIRYNLSKNHFFIFESEDPKATIDQMISYLKKKFSLRLKDIPVQVACIVAPEFLSSLIEEKPITPTFSLSYKPIKRKSKRGIFLQLILDGTVHIPSIAKTLSMSRNNVLSYLYQIQKVNGVDYTLNKELDTVDIYMPKFEVWV